MDLNKIARLTDRFFKVAQITGDEKAIAEGTILRAIGVRDNNNRDNFQPFFEKVINPWIGGEAKASNIKPGDNWGVKMEARPGSVAIFGTINNQKGKISDNFFGKVSAKATQAVAGKQFPDFDMWLSEPQVYEEE